MLFDDELSCQAKALDLLSHKNSSIAEEIVCWHEMIIPYIFRKIIKHFELKHNRLPEAEELINITNKILKEDIRKIYGFFTIENNKRLNSN